MASRSHGLTPTSGTLVRPMPSPVAETRPEPDLFRQALGAKDIKLEIKPDASKTDVLSTLDFAMQGYDRITGAANKLKPIIGKLLHSISMRKLYRPEYPTLRGYIEAAITAKYDLSPSWAFEAMAGAKLAPTLTNDQFKAIGAAKLQAIAKRRPKDPVIVAELISAASEAGTVQEFSAKLDALAPTRPRPEPTSFGVAFRTRFPEIPDEWAKFCLRQDVQQWAESTDQGRILVLCMACAEADLKGGKAPTARRR